MSGFSEMPIEQGSRGHRAGWTFAIFVASFDGEGEVKYAGESDSAPSRYSLALPGCPLYRTYRAAIISVCGADHSVAERSGGGRSEISYFWFATPTLIRIPPVSFTHKSRRPIA